jgi:hypothetical protein
LRIIKPQQVNSKFKIQNKTKEKKVKRKRNEPLTRPTVPNPAHFCFPQRGQPSSAPRAARAVAWDPPGGLSLALALSIPLVRGTTRPGHFSALADTSDPVACAGCCPWRVAQPASHHLATTSAHGGERAGDPGATRADLARPQPPPGPDKKLLC